MLFIQRQGEFGSLDFVGDAARVILSDGSVVVDWTTGGTIADIPQGDGYTLEILRDGVVSREALAVGVIVLALGQSNMAGWFRLTEYQRPVSTGVYDLDTDRYSTPGVGAREFAEQLSRSLGGVPVGFVNAAVGGSALLPELERSQGEWLSRDAGNIYDRALAQLAAVGGRAEVALWIQGESEASAGIPFESYRDGFNILLDRIHADVPGTMLVIGGIGIWRDIPDEFAQAIRDAQIAAAAGREDVVYVPTPLDSDLLDAVHLSDPSAAWQAIGMAAAAVEMLTGSAPSPAPQGGEEGDTFTGSNDRDAYLGNGGDDLIVGGDGDDLLLGRTGDDTVAGDAGRDILSGGDGADVVSGGDDDDLILGDSGDDVLYGEAGNDVIYGGDGADVLDGGVGADLLNGGAGADTLIGGDGDDVFVVNDAADVIVEEADGGSDVVRSSVDYRLSENIERLVVLRSSATVGIGSNGDNIIETQNIVGTSLYGEGGNDLVLGSFGADSLYGGVGNDTLRGATNADLMHGGDGDDIFYVENAGDVVVENADEGNDWVFSTLDYTLPDHVENLSMADGWTRNGTGNNLANILISSAAPTTLRGLGGDDTLIGGNSYDVLDGGSGADRMVGGRGNDTYVVDHASDVIVEAADGGVDLVRSSVDFVLGAYLEQLALLGTAISGDGNAVANAITGNDLSNVLAGREGNDTIRGGDGNDTIDGGIGADSLFGDNGADLLFGREGADVLNGGVGADTMEGGADNDTYHVDNRFDVVVEAANAGVDTVNSTLAAYTLGVNLEYLILGAGALDGTGNTLNNRLTGNDLNNYLAGNAGADLLTGGGGDDRLDGGEGSDTLDGGAGLDRLDGGVGADRMTGGAGNDQYVVDHIGDLVVETADGGVSDFVTSSISYALGEHVERLTLSGTSNLNGAGNDLGNRIIGNTGNNLLTGAGGVDLLEGGAGDDTLVGGLMNDALTGGIGRDLFVFDTRLGFDNLDSIADFNIADDRIALASSIFGLPVGALAEGAFAVGAAGDADDRIIYNAATGGLFFDANGSLSGGAMRFAIIGANLELTASHFVII